MIYFIVWLTGAIIFSVLCGIAISYETNVYKQELYEDKSIILALLSAFWFIVLPLFIFYIIREETTKKYTKYLKNKRAKRKAAR